jgi:hypothetical protein
VGGNTARLAEKFGLERMFVGSVAAHGTKVALHLALVDVQKHKQIGKTSLLLAADGTDADQLEDETRAAAKKLSLIDAGDGKTQAEPAAPAAAAPASTPGKPAEPGRAVATPVDELGLATKERRPQPAPTAQGPAPAGEKPKEQTKKKPKKLKEVTGTEGWDD